MHACGCASIPLHDVLFGVVRSLCVNSIAVCFNESCIRFDPNGNNYSNVNVSEKETIGFLFVFHLLSHSLSRYLSPSLSLASMQSIPGSWPTLPRYIFIYGPLAKDIVYTPKRKSDRKKCYRMMCSSILLLCPLFGRTAQKWINTGKYVHRNSV